MCRMSTADRISESGNSAVQARHHHNESDRNEKYLKKYLPSRSRQLTLFSQLMVARNWEEDCELNHTESTDEADNTTDLGDDYGDESFEYDEASPSDQTEQLGLEGRPLPLITYAYAYHVKLLCRRSEHYQVMRQHDNKYRKIYEPPEYIERFTTWGYGVHDCIDVRQELTIAYVAKLHDGHVDKCDEDHRDDQRFREFHGIVHMVAHRRRRGGKTVNEEVGGQGRQEIDSTSGSDYEILRDAISDHSVGRSSNYNNNHSRSRQDANSRDKANILDLFYPRERYAYERPESNPGPDYLAFAFSGEAESSPEKEVAVEDDGCGNSKADDTPKPAGARACAR
ncbi:hypothetical protein FOZ61_003320 [Perkinsus olseni]|uniref:Uncharacterized protein n=1 Tax=Perkinsus olseni TaxID=32597 RepID=A0A7J6ME83_PEROL|nr:hypothetical protein FOZ61_003320 [Perkinsus olseni]